MIFHDVTLRAGRVLSAREHDSRALLGEAVAVFRGMLSGHVPGDFRRQVAFQGCHYITLAWTCEEACPTVAFASFYAGGQCYTSSILLSGQAPHHERQIMDLFQDMIDDVFACLPEGPGRDLEGIRHRPLIASVPFPAPIDEDGARTMALIADMETCLAAAFFTLGEE